MTSRSSSDTDEEDINPQLYQAVPDGQHHNDVISDDSDGDDTYKSMYNIMTPLHVPGRHKLENFARSSCTNRVGQGDNTFSCTAHDDDELLHKDPHGDHVSPVNNKAPEEFGHEENPIIDLEGINPEADRDQETKSDEKSPQLKMQGNVEVPATITMILDGNHTILSPIEDKTQEEQSISDMELGFGANPVVEIEDTTIESDESILTDTKSTQDSQVLGSIEVPASTKVIPDRDCISSIADEIQEEQNISEFEFDKGISDMELGFRANPVVEIEDTTIESDESILTDTKSTQDSQVLGSIEVPASTKVIPDRDCISSIPDEIREEQNISELEFDKGTNEILEKDETATKVPATTTLIPVNPESDNIDDIKTQKIELDFQDSKNETTTITPVYEIEQNRSFRISEEGKNQSDSKTVDVESTENSDENDTNNTNDATDDITGEEYCIDQAMDIQELEEQSERESDGQNEQSVNNITETSSILPSYLVTDTMMADLSEKGSISSSFDFSLIEVTPSLALFGDSASEINTNSNDPDKKSDSEHDIPDTVDITDGGCAVSVKKFENSFDSDAESMENKAYVNNTTCSNNDNDGVEDDEMKTQKIIQKKKEKEYQDSDDEYQSAEEGEYIESTSNDKIDSNDGKDDNKEDNKMVDEKTKEDFQQGNEEFSYYGDGNEKFITSLVNLTDHSTNDLKTTSESLNNSKIIANNLKQGQSLEKNTSLQESNSSSIIVLSRDRSLYEFQSESSKIPSGELTDTDNFSLSDNSQTPKIDDIKEGNSLDKVENDVEFFLGMQDVDTQGKPLDEMGESYTVLSYCSGSSSILNSSAKQAHADFTKEVIPVENTENKVIDHENGTKHTKLSKREEKYNEENCDENRQSNNERRVEPPPIPPKSLGVFEHVASSILQSMKGNTNELLEEPKKYDDDNTISISSNASDHLDSSKKSDIVTLSAIHPPSIPNSSAKHDHADFTKENIPFEHYENEVIDDENGLIHTKQSRRVDQYIEERCDENRLSNSRIRAEPPPVPPKSLQVLEHIASVSMESITKSNTDKMLKEAEKDYDGNTVSVSLNVSEHLDSSAKSDHVTSSPKLPPKAPRRQIQSSLPSAETPLSYQSSIQSPMSQTGFMQQQSNFLYGAQEYMSYMYQHLTPEQQQEYLYNLYLWQAQQCQDQPFIPEQQPASSNPSSDEWSSNYFKQNASKYKQSPQAFWEPGPMESPNMNAMSANTDTQDTKTMEQVIVQEPHVSKGQKQQQVSAKQPQAQSLVKHSYTESSKENQKHHQDQDRKKTEIPNIHSSRKPVMPKTGIQNSSKPTTSETDAPHSLKPVSGITGKQNQAHPVPAPRKKRSQMEHNSDILKHTSGRPRVTEDHQKSSEKISFLTKDNFHGVKTEPKMVPVKTEKSGPNTVPVKKEKSGPNTVPVKKEKSGPNTVPVKKEKSGPNTVPVKKEKSGPNTVPVKKEKSGPNTVPVKKEKSGPNTVPVKKEKPGQNTVPVKKEKSEPDTVPVKKEKIEPNTVPVKKEKIIAEVESKPEKCLLYITGMDPKTTSENLFNYLEGGQEDQIIEDPFKEHALIVYAEKPDMDKLYHKVETKPIDGKHLKCQEISLPKLIAVSFDAPISHPDNLLYYFESKGNGGGAVIGQVTESEDGSCYFLEFEDPKVVERLCNRSEPHIFEKHVLHVTPCYTCEDKAIWDHKIHPIPKANPVDLKLPGRKFAFLKRCCLVPLKAQIVGKHGQLELGSAGLTVICTLTPKQDGFKTLVKVWHHEMVNLIEDFIKDNIKETYINLDDEPEVWTRLLQAAKLEDEENLNIHLDSSLSQIQLTGFEDNINRRKDEILKTVETIRRVLRRKTKTKTFNKFKLGLLVAMGKFGELQEEFDDVKMAKDGTNVTVEGQEDDIQAVFVKIFENFSKMREESKKHKYSRACVQFIKANKGIMSKIGKAVTDKNILAVWDLQDAELRIACPDEFEPTEVANIIFSKIAETPMELDRDMKIVLKTEEWIKFCQDEIESCQDECQIQVDTTLVVYGYADSVSVVYQHVKTFFDENTLRILETSMDPINLQYIENFCGDKVKEIEKNNESQNVTIWLQGKEAKVVIYGKKAGRQEAKVALEKLAKTVVSDNHKIEKIGIKGVYSFEMTKGSIDMIGKETRCLIKSDFEEDASRFLRQDYDTISNVRSENFETAEVSEATEDREAVPENRDFKCKNGIVILQIEGEIGRQSADVLVASCSPNLDLNLGGASRSLLKHGGSGLQEELRKNQTEIKTGEIMVLSGANLECNSVFLTTLPQWSSDNVCLSLIQKFMTECLHRLAKMKKRSIIFSVLGTGQLKYPPNQVAQMMYQAVIDFDIKTPKTTVEEVNFVIYPTDIHIKQAFEEEVITLKSGGGIRQTFDVQFNNVKVEMVIEDIAAQKVDAILCSTSDDFDLSKSGAAKALLKAGGKTLQEKASTYKQSGLKGGQVGKISAGTLPCKAVFLTNLPSYSPENIQVLRKAIQAFLEVCNREGYTSVAMPAMGTGFLKYPTPMVSRTLFEAVQSWSNSAQTGSVRSVRFVMYAKDYEVIQAFKSQIKTLTGGSVRRGRAFTKHFPKKDSQQSQKYTMFDSGCHIGSTRLTVKVGDILTENADAIVSSVGVPCEFLGAVAQSILKKCPKLEKTCTDKKDKLQKKGILCTKTDGGLPCKHVIHVHFQESLGNWQSIVQKCLEKANKKGFRSLAFPVLGTGQGNTTFRPEDIAGCMFSAIDNFAFKNISGRRTLKDIRLVIFNKQHATKHPIMRAIESKTKSTKDSKGMFNKVKGLLSDAKDRVIRTITGSATAKVEMADSCIIVTIHSDSKTNIDKCKKKLDETLEHNYVKLKIESYKEIVKSLSSDELKHVEGTQHLVNMKIDQPNGIITIHGPKRDVSDAHSEALNKLRLLEAKALAVKESKTLYTLVKWHHEDITASGTNLEAYDEMSNLIIETAYRNNEGEVELEDVDKEVYVIKFNDMVEYPKRDPTDQVRVVRKDIIKAGDANIPPTWTTMQDQENMKMVILQPSDQEYKTVESTFVNGVKKGGFANRIPNVQNIAVTKIERIQNKTLYQQYLAKKKQMENTKQNLQPQFQPMERILWHGTAGDAVASIQRHGFNRSYCGKNGIWYGAGVYFANDPSYSARPWLAMGQQNPPLPAGQNKGYVFMCKVLTGQYLKGDTKMRYLPPIDASKDKTLMYDSSVDNVQIPTEFVIYNDTQAYPEYIITFSV